MGSSRSRSRSRDRHPRRHHHRHHRDRSRDRSRDRHYRGRDRDRNRDRDNNDKNINVVVKREKIEDEIQRPDFTVSGKLMEDTNVFNGVVIKYSEPEEARKPKRRWRFYVFKGDETLPILHLHRQSAFLLGRDRKIVDIPIDHPSCSKQHAAFQYRAVPGNTNKPVIKPYVMDLGSANGTFLNNKRIEAQRYYELQEKDVLKFGYSSREYVLLHDQSEDS